MGEEDITALMDALYELVSYDVPEEYNIDISMFYGFRLHIIKTITRLEPKDNRYT